MQSLTEADLPKDIAIQDRNAAPCIVRESTGAVHMALGVVPSEVCEHRIILLREDRLDEARPVPIASMCRSV